MTPDADAGPPAGPGDAWLVAHGAHLLDFAAPSVPSAPGGPAWWLDDTGAPDPSRPRFTWVTARMTHVFSLAALDGRDGADGAADVAARAVRGLAHDLHDDEHDGWLHALGGDADATDGGDDEKSAYDHVFVVLAGATATAAGVAGGPALLDRALAVLDERFWEAGPGLLLDTRSADWTRTGPYRGVNANMHGVEALLAAHGATGDVVLLDRARGIAARVVGWAQPRGWRVPEHFSEDWQPRPEHHTDDRAHPFQPYGVTVGHGLEWARLLVHLDLALRAAGRPEPWCLPAARSLFDAAVADGWERDGAPGFVYTVDWDGEPVVRDRLHWVAAEGIGAAAVLHAATGEDRYAAWAATWWAYVREHLVDDDAGSWHHELDPANRPAANIWAGKPDVYHAYQATLLARAPLRATLAESVVAAAG